MDIPLMAAFDLGLIVVILEVALALGAVIFVHELGHFAVAKWCGVRCDKFYIGFDIYGLRLWRRQWGETEYGIGILPLGGYVKMLGQDDNPARMAEEMERAKAAAVAQGGAGAEPAFDPRSYPAQSVPKRMAIISAGVIMNLIFAVIFATVAYRLGVKYSTCAVSNVTPGDAAWQHNIRPGDEIVEINGLRDPSFRDLQTQVALGFTNPVVLKVKKHGSGEEAEVRIPLGDRKEGQIIRTIGVSLPVVPILGGETEKDDKLKLKPVRSTPFGRSGVALRPGDRIVALNGQPMETYGDLNQFLAQHVEEDVTMTLERREGDAAPQKIDLPVAKNPQKQLGLRLDWGRVVAVQHDSPADRAGLKPDDVIVEVAGRAAATIDPLTWPDELRRRAAEVPSASLELTLERDGVRRLATLTPRVPTWFETYSLANQDLSVPALGLVCEVTTKVLGLDEQGPAAKHAELVGKELVKIVLAPPKPADGKEDEESKEATYELTGKRASHLAAVLLGRLQSLPPGAAARLYIEGREEPFECSVVDSDHDFVAARGIPLEAAEKVRQADSWSEAASLGFKETRDSVLQVYLFLQKLFDGGVSPRGLGGPITIAQQAGQSAYEGFGQLLIFLTMLSANLAVINFLPIPVLDGGHMVFLLYEAIFRRPPNARIMEFLTIGGLFLLLSLMVFVFGLDLGFIARH